MALLAEHVVDEYEFMISVMEMAFEIFSLNSVSKLVKKNIQKRGLSFISNNKSLKILFS